MKTKYSTPILGLCLSFGFITEASAQVMPINSLKSAKNLPAIEKIIAHTEALATDPSGHLIRVKKAILRFKPEFQKTLFRYGLTELDISLQEKTTNFEAEDSNSAVSSNVAQTRISLLRGKAGILSLKEAFSFPQVQTALITWSQNHPLLLIEGGAAWKIQEKIPTQIPVDREYFTASKHLTDLFTDGQAVCMKELTEVGKESHQEVTCLLAFEDEKLEHFPLNVFQQNQITDSIQSSSAPCVQQQQQQRQQIQIQEQPRQSTTQQVQQQRQQRQQQPYHPLPICPTPQENQFGQSVQQQQQQKQRQQQQQQRQQKQQQQGNSPILAPEAPLDAT